MRKRAAAPVFRAQRAADPGGWAHFAAPFALAAFALLQIPTESVSFKARESRRAAAPARVQAVRLSPGAAEAARLAVRTAWQVGGERGSSLDCDGVDAVFDSVSGDSFFRSAGAMPPLPRPALAAIDAWTPDPLRPPTAAAGMPPEFPEEPAARESASSGFSRSSMLEFEDLRPFKKGNRTNE